MKAVLHGDRHAAARLRNRNHFSACKGIPSTQITAQNNDLDMRRWFLVSSCSPVSFYFISANWPYRYRKIHPLLEDVFASQVKITRYHRTYFPNPGFMATGIILRRKSAPDLPPLGTVETLFVQGRWSDL